MEQFQPILNLLQGKAGWLPTVLMWMSALRLVLKPFSGKVQAKIAGKMAEAAASQDLDEERDWESVLKARWYRITTFILDLFFSFKLPTRAEFARAMDAAAKPKPPPNP